MPPITLRVIGESVIEIGSTRVEPTATHLFSLLLYLCLERDRAIGRRELCSLLFPSSREADASHSLRQLIYRAKRIGAPIQARQSTVFIEAGAVAVDLAAVLGGAESERVARVPSSVDLLPHFSPPTPPLSTWLESYRDRMRPQLIRRFSREIESLRAKGDWHSLESVAKQLLQLDPFNETATLCLAEALARIGSKKDAVALLRRFELEVGKVAHSLTIPPRILARRISEPPTHDVGPIETPMFGRDNVMSQLAGYWNWARGGHFTSVLVCGTESIGKSRLASDFASSVRIEDTGTVISTRRSPLDEQRPLSLFSDIAKQLLTLRGAAGCSRVTLSFLARLTQTTDTGELTADEERFEHFDNAVRKAVTDLLDCVLSERPLLLLVDDAEHLDEASLTLLQHIQRCLQGSPCFVLLVSRSSTLADSIDAVKVRLGPIDPDNAQRLGRAIAASLGHCQTMDCLERDVDLAAGNPGHLRLLLVNRVRTRGNDDIPTDLIAAIDTRLNSLSAKALHTLQSCVFFGTPSSASDIQALTGLRGYSLVSSMQELEDSALIEFKAGGMRCASRLIEDRVLATASPAVTALLHLRAAQHLERNLSTTGASQALSWRIAEHWSKAGAHPAALRWRQRCWQQLLAIGQPLAAVEGIQAALCVVSSTVERAALLSALAVALRTLGDFASSAQVLEDRSALGDEVNDSITAKIALAFDLIEARVVHSPDLTPHIGALQGYVREANLDPARRLRAARLLMIATDHAFDLRAARGAFSWFRGIRPTDPSVALFQLHACLIYHTTFGHRSKAVACLSRIEQLAAQQQRSWIRVASATSSFVAQRVIAVGPQSIGILEQAFEECEEGGVYRSALIIASMLTSALFDDGRFDEATKWGMTARQAIAKLPVDDSLTDHPVGLIDLALHDGHLHDAEVLLRSFLASAPTAAGPRLQREMLVYKCRVDQLCGRGTTDRDLKELLRFHTLASRFGRHDDNVEVLWIALHERGSFDQASALLHEYLTTSRRETRRCNFWLRTRTAKDRIWKDPSFEHLA